MSATLAFKSDCGKEKGNIFFRESFVSIWYFRNGWEFRHYCRLLQPTHQVRDSSPLQEISARLWVLWLRSRALFWHCQWYNWTIEEIYFTSQSMFMNSVKCTLFTAGKSNYKLLFYSPCLSEGRAVQGLAGTQSSNNPTMAPPPSQVSPHTWHTQL